MKERAASSHHQATNKEGKTVRVMVFSGRRLSPEKEGLFLVENHRRKGLTFGMDLALTFRILIVFRVGSASFSEVCAETIGSGSLLPRRMRCRKSMSCSFLAAQQRPLPATNQ
jgi:hypothetical protein